MGSLFDGTDGMENIEEIYDRMETNYPGSPCSTSKKLWKLRHACDIASHNTSSGTMLDKAVAMLAKKGEHMHGWFNRCPVAAGITDPYSDNNRRVDLVHWCELCRCARLIELKWKSGDPLSALRQILRYGAAYIFCWVHKGKLTFPEKCLIEKNIRHVSLEVVAPHRFYNGYDERVRFAQISKFLDEFADSKTGGTLSMSLNALAFPEEFEIPFKNGEEVKDKCNTLQLTEEGQAICNAFHKLAPVWP